MAEEVVDQNAPGSEHKNAAPVRRLRWWPAAVLVVLVVIAHVIAWQFAGSDLTLQVFLCYPIQGLFWLAMTLWWLFGSGIAWKYRLIGEAVVLATLFGIGNWVVRVETFSGNMIPQLAWKWTPTREERAAAYRKEQRAKRDKANPDDQAIADPENETPAFEITNDDWPGYRGAIRDGIAPPMKIRRDWEQNPPALLWKHPVGLGWSSFAIVGDYCFTQEQRLEDEVVVCYELRTGIEVWSHADKARFSEALGGDGPRGTPTIHDGKVYSLGGTGILNCLDALTGKKIWSHAVLEEIQGENLPWGMCASPLVYDDVVVVNPGGPKEAPADFDHAIIAYDRFSGEEVWHIGRSQGSYCAPQLSVLDGVRQLLIFDHDGMSGHDPANGKELWQFEWTNQPGVNAAQPIFVAPLQVFAGNGYGVGSTVRQIIHNGDDWSVAPEPVWSNKKFRLKFQAAVLHEGYLYGLSEGILSCVNAGTGEDHWKKGRYKYGQLLLVDGLLVVLAESGEVALVEATPAEYRELAKFQAIEGQTWNHPAISRGLLLVRNGAEAACYDISD